MKIIIRPRGIGKTTDLIKLAAEKNYYIVVRDYSEARRVFNEAYKMNLYILFPITYDNLRNYEYGRLVNGFLLDNAENFLQYLFKGKLEGLTVTYGTSLDLEI